MRDINFGTLHHAAVHQEDIDKAIASFNRTHKERLHPTANSLGYHIAYHRVIGWNGEVVQTREEADVGYINGSRKSNNESIGICLVGNFDVTEPSEAQISALLDLLKSLKKRYPGIQINGHRDIVSYKSCPGKFFPLSRIKLLYNNNSLMSIFKQVWLQEVPEDQRIFGSYEDDRPLTVEDGKYLFDIGNTRDNKKDRSYVFSIFIRLKEFLKSLV